jgi:hypothetical protein
VADRLQIEEHLQFQHRNWLLQRFGWCALALLLLAGLTGLLGPGPLSRTTGGDGRGLEIEYERFIRHGAQADLFFEVASHAIALGQARLLVGRKFLQANRLERIDPEPTSSRSLGEYVEYRFDTEDGQPLAVRFTYEPDQIGSHSIPVRLSGAPEVRVVQFTYP